MKDLYSFLDQTSNQSDFKANLSNRGGFITFSNSGRRGGVKYFQIGLDNLLQTLKDILGNLEVFADLTDYVEKSWRDNGSAYFTDPVANANSTVQTKPLFSTLSKIIIWANQPDLDSINPDNQIILTEHSLSRAIEKLEAIAETFRPKSQKRPTSSETISNLVSNSSYLPYLTALRTKPFMLLAGISGTGKSRIVRELAFKSCPSYLQDEYGTTPSNYCMIEVKPNWHDSSELLGYYSNIAGQYIYTDFVKFLVKAMMFPEVPFFVCLDEMNLAPVEQYFAEFLSVLETRKKTESGIKTGALVKAKYFEDLPDADRGDGYIYTQWFPDIKQNVPYNIYTNPTLKTKGLGLPENVFVIGTVNMDDTTHQFSRKVLDRAMTIEMNGGELKEMFGHSNDLEYLPEENVWKIDQFKPQYVNADEVLEVHPAEEEALKTQLADKLDTINNVLKDTPFVVSYRVLNELVIYAGVLLDDGREINEAINEAVDQITLMKILPRIEGDEDMLGNAKDENNRLCQLMKVVGSQSQTKLKEMNRRLESGFTRFWP